jgi:hypothetical protein
VIDTWDVRVVDPQDRRLIVVGVAVDVGVAGQPQGGLDLDHAAGGELHRR